MRGRSSAALVAATAAVLFWLFPPFLIVASAVVALVTLRQGTTEGAGVLLLAGVAATALAWVALGAPWPMLRILLPCWLAVWLLAWLLRTTVSLSRTFQAAALLGLLGVVGFYLMVGDPTGWWTQALDRLQHQLVTAAPANQAGQQDTLSQLLELLKSWAPLLPGQAVSTLLLIVLLALLLGRWWQALLFNPGGFGPEFHQLRLGSALAAFTLLLIAAALLSNWPPLVNAMLVMGMIYTVQGIALVHALAFKWQLSPAWLLLFYLLLIPLLSQIVMALGIADAWLDLRTRIRGRATKQ